MLFSKFSEYLQKIDSTSSRLDMTKILSDMFKDLEGDEISSAVNISLGQLRPKYDKLEFQIAEKMIFKALAEAFGLEESEVNAQYKLIGDIGDTAFKIMESSTKTQESSLSVGAVFSKLEIIATYSGNGSQDEKVQGLAELFAQLDPLSSKYIARMVVGKLRLGFSDMTILDALSWMERGDKTGRKKLEEAFQLSPDIAEITRLTKKHSIDHVSDKIEIKVGVPIIPALAQRLKTADEMLNKMGKVMVDPKYDGTRVQIHYKRQETRDKKQDLIKTFTRNLDESSYMFPELEKVGEYLNADEVILDCEAIGYDSDTGALLPFQMTIQRKRKHGIQEAAKDIPLKFFVFDIMYKDGIDLISMPLHDRVKVLEETIIDGPVLEMTEFITTEDADEIRKYHADLLAQGLEGAMVKKYGGIYNPGRKGWAWVKFKEVEGSAAKLSDTIDAVVMGLYVGKGKRTKFGVGAFLIGIRAGESGTSNAELGIEEGSFYTISKVGTGLTDDQWIELKERSKIQESGVKNKLYEVHKDLEPDIWLDPGIVVEVAADEITISQNHTAGYALRFPRLVNFRDDKDAGQVTSLQELKSIS